MSRTRARKIRIIELRDKLERLVYAEKEVELPRAMAELGYLNRTYFVNSVLPIVLEFTACIEFDRVGQRLLWSCDDEERVRAEARAVLEQHVVG